jgi:hypothetical protein
VDRDDVVLLDADAPERGGHLVDLAVEVLVRDVLLLAVRALPQEGRLVLPLVEVAVDTVVRGVELPADEPLEERRVRPVEHLVPVLVPVEQVGVLLEPLGELPDLVVDRRVRGVGLPDELRRGSEVLLLAEPGLQFDVGCIV